MHLRKYKKMIIALTVILGLCAAGTLALAADATRAGRSVAAGSLIARSNHGSHHRGSHRGSHHRGSHRGLRHGGSRKGLRHEGSRRGLRHGGSRHSLRHGRSRRNLRHGDSRRSFRHRGSRRSFRGGYYDRRSFGLYEGPPLARHYKSPRTAPHYGPYPRVAPHYRPYPRLAPHYRPYRYGGRRSGYQIKPHPGSYYRSGPNRQGYYYFYFSLPYRRYTYNYWPYYRAKIYPQHPLDYPYYEIPQPYDQKPTLPQQAEMELEDSRIAQQLGIIARAFVQGDYDSAVERARKATDEIPQSTVLPFVYSQSLFAAGQYDQAADVLRTAILEVDLETQGLFFPAGFYADMDILNDQIAELSNTAAADRNNADLQLLLGYQLLGLAAYDQAAEALDLAELDYTNKEAAVSLKYILEQTKKIEAEAPKNQK